MIAIDNILDGLNRKQREVVTQIDGKFLVLASAGAGKTKSIVSRIEYLMACGVKPWHIMAISFTRKASNEIRERVEVAVGEDGLDVKMGTFHSICMRILIPNQAALGISNLTILDSNESDRILKDIAFANGVTDEEGFRIAKNLIDRWQNANITALEAATYADVPREYPSIYLEYTNYKQSVGYIDFNDILFLTIKLFRNRPDILQKYSSGIHYLMIDEAQDLNDVQFELMRLFSSAHGNYLLIGDDLQCIYSFRGSNVRNMMNIRDIDPDIHTILLEQNYRSTKAIVEASNGFIAHNTDQLEKVSFTDNEYGMAIQVYEAEDETKEGDFIVQMIEGLVRTRGCRFSDFAVIYRTNFQSRNIELSFGRAGIPYDVVGASEFYRREEIKTLVCYLRVVDNLMDSLALEQIVNRPKRNIGDATLNRIKVFANGSNLSLHTALEHVEDIPKINRTTKANIAELLTILAEARRMVLQDGARVSDVLTYLIHATHYMGQYNVTLSEDEQKVENISELYDVALSFDNKEKEELVEGQTILTQFLTETALFEDAGSGNDHTRVTLTTVHSAKGLEFPVVFMIGLEDGTFPSSLVRGDEEYSEERRLFYVGMTRAKSILFLTHNKKKFVRGQVLLAKPSPFLAEIPQQYVRHLGRNKIQ